MDRRNKYQDKFSELKAPVDKDLLWNKISSDKKFPTNQRKTRITIWLCIVGLIAISYSGLNYWFELSNATFSENTNPRATNKNGTLQPFEIKNDLSAKANSLVKSTNDEVKLISKNTYNSAQALDIKQLENSKTLDESIDSNNSISTISTEPAAVSTDNNMLASSILSQEVNRLLIDSRHSDLAKDNSLPTVVENSDKDLPNDKKQLQVMKIQALDIRLTYFQNYPLLESKQIISQDVIKHWDINFSIGTGYHYRGFEVIDPDLPNNYTSLLKNNTRSLESYTFSLDLNRHLPKNWTIGLGLQFSRIHEEYRYYNVTIDYKRNEVSDIPFYSSAEKTEVTAHNFHQFQQLDMKLQVGKRWRLNKFGFGINSGMLYNLDFNVKGNLTSESLDQIPIADNLAYRSSLGLRYFIATEVRRSFLMGNIFTSLQIESPYKLNQENASFQHEILPIYLKVGYSIGF